jgi:hypothetical protein
MDSRRSPKDFVGDPGQARDGQPIFRKFSALPGDRLGFCLSRNAMKFYKLYLTAPLLSTLSVGRVRHLGLNVRYPTSHTGDPARLPSDVPLFLPKTGTYSSSRK